MSRGGKLQSYYRRSDKVSRYLLSSREARTRVGKVLRNEGRFFGRRVLDLGCGGGALGFLLESPGRSYLGIDANPDMIGGARATARERKSACKFVLQDVTRSKVHGKHDTVALIGNTLAHFSPEQFAKVLGNLTGAVHSGSFLIVSYRDVVGELLHGRWRIGKTTRVRTSRGTIEVGSAGADLAQGLILVRMKSSWFRNATRSTHAIWSPYILSSLAGLFGWRFVHRRRVGDQCVDVYRLDGRIPPPPSKRRGSSPHR
jgi:SAM-dependent methyltransferase